MVYPVLARVAIPSSSSRQWCHHGAYGSTTDPPDFLPRETEQMALSSVQNKALCDLIEHELEEMVRPHLVALGLQPIAVRMVWVIDVTVYSQGAYEVVRGGQN